MSDTYKDFIKENAERLMVEGKKYAEKYKPLVSGIKDDYTKIMTAILMENEVQFADRLLTESTTSGQSIGTAGQFIKYALPIIRRVFPNLIANKLVGVQPLMQPVGFIFYLRYKFAETRGSAAAGTQMNLLQTAGLPNTNIYNPASPYRNFPVNPYYAKQIVDNHMVVDATGLRVSNISADVAPTNYFSAGPTNVGDATTGAGDFALPLQTTAPSVSTPFYVNILEADPALSNFNTILCTYKYDGAALTITYGSASSLTVNSVAYNPGTRIATINATSTCATDVVIRGMSMQFNYNLEANADISELNITIDKETVEAKTRKLKTVWTPESAQDFKSYHGIDVEAELTALMSQEIALEIDREILADLVNIGAQVTHYWDQGAATNYNYLDRHVALMQRILLESNNIMRDTLRGKANWLVTSPEIASVLETLKEFKPYGGQVFTGINQSGIGARGVLLNQIDVYVDPIFPVNKIVLGYKGASVVDAGYYYAPYVPVELTPVIYDPYDFTPRRGLLTRYATKKIELGEKFYRTIKLQNSSTDVNFNPVLL
jgi:hypothetical protein